MASRSQDEWAADPAASLASVSDLVARIAPGPPAGAPAESSLPSGADLLAALTALRVLRDQLASWEPALIAAARAAGVSWAELAPALGVGSRQAAERRFLRLQPSGAGDQRTGEERVRDERDRRAGDRAVTAWARRNSGTLRQLAGRIGALEGLPAAAQQRVGVVQDALAADDAFELLHPLAAAESHLAGQHAPLAEQVRSVTDELDRVRRDAHGQRGADAGR
jgi:hypothetical protein